MTESARNGHISVSICDTQPILAEGVRAVLAQYPDFHIATVTHCFDEFRLQNQRERANVVLLDKAAAGSGLINWIEETRRSIATVVWANSIGESEALRMVQAGVRGVLRKSVPPVKLIDCLNAVVGGQCWMEDAVARSVTRDERYPRSELTPRETQVLALVEAGLRNRDIARELGIRPGTVKIHLKHIFEKTGVRGRYGLALTGLRHKGLLSFARAEGATI
jgi:two-component system nitrate/nitrite response regulator NarL